jgi:hypothetical protein
VFRDDFHPSHCQMTAKCLHFCQNYFTTLTVIYVCEKLTSDIDKHCWYMEYCFKVLFLFVLTDKSRGGREKESPKRTE